MAEAVAASKPAEKRRRQEALGQFLTPAPVGDFMASLVSALPPTVRLLDAGAGGGALIAALVRRVCGEGLGVRTLHATAYEIDDPRDPERFIHIPADTGHASAKAKLEGLPASLASLGLNVSTGRVVDFRFGDALLSAPAPGSVPLLYPCHFQGGGVHWPKTNSRKPNAILDNDETRPWLVPSGVYLLTKRFTSKEERRRLVAFLFDPEEVTADWLGFENHLNYFHANGTGLERRLALGLFVFLNSTLVDHYFRCFSGHTQVNATDLRRLPYPDADTLRAMGGKLKRLDASQEELDRIADSYLHGR